MCILFIASSQSPKVCNTVQNKLKVPELHNMLPKITGSTYTNFVTPWLHTLQLLNLLSNLTKAIFPLPIDLISNLQTRQVPSRTLPVLQTVGMFAGSGRSPVPKRSELVRFLFESIYNVL